MIVHYPITMLKSGAPIWLMGRATPPIVWHQLLYKQPYHTALLYAIQALLLLGTTVIDLCLKRKLYWQKHSHACYM